MAINQQLLILSVIAAIVIIIDCGRTSLKIVTSSALGLAGLAALHFTAFAVPLNAVTIGVSFWDCRESARLCIYSTR